VSQHFTSDVSGVADSFDYVLTASDANAPMPDGSTGRTYAFSLTGDGSTTIDIDCASAAPGKYTYRLADASDHVDGYTYETRVYVMTLYVSTGCDPVVTVERESDGVKVAKIELDPSYAEPAPATTTSATTSSSSSAGPLARTGDMTDMTIPVAFAALAFVALAGALALGRRRCD
jgi:hypothetical protein